VRERERRGRERERESEEREREERESEEREREERESGEREREEREIARARMRRERERVRSAQLPTTHNHCFLKKNPPHNLFFPHHTQHFFVKNSTGAAPAEDLKKGGEVKRETR
jgi:hypothetical protein